MEFTGKKALVIGLGISGRAACRFLLRAGADVTAYDQKASLIAGETEVKELVSSGLKLTGSLECVDTDFLIPSPGIAKTHPLYRQAAAAGVKIIGEAELAFSHMSVPAIGITGTNGKTTVTEMTAHILNDSGKTAFPLGNNGAALTDRPQNEGIVVAELSSYQIETLATPALDVAVILNISPDHLDRYESIEEYAAAKFRLQNILKPGAPFYLHPDLIDRYPSLIKKNVASYITEDVSTFEEENLLASFHLVKHFGISENQFKKSASTFCKPPHRLEFVKEVKGVYYYNDSKGTNIDSVLKAVGSFSGKVILIAGGKDKGVSFQSWIKPFISKVLCICALGEAKEKIYRELSPHLTVKKFGTLACALDYSSSIAKEGETVLLSPGCSSFDQYANFEERGNEFKKIVMEKLFDN